VHKLTLDLLLHAARPRPEDFVLPLSGDRYPCHFNTGFFLHCLLLGFTARAEIDAAVTNDDDLIGRRALPWIGRLKHRERIYRAEHQPKHNRYRNWTVCFHNKNATEGITTLPWRSRRILRCNRRSESSSLFRLNEQSHFLNLVLRTLEINVMNAKAIVATLLVAAAVHADGVLPGSIREKQYRRMRAVCGPEWKCYPSSGLAEPRFRAAFCELAP
jgi:hypothetical protein